MSNSALRMKTCIDVKPQCPYCNEDYEIPPAKDIYTDENKDYEVNCKSCGLPFKVAIEYVREFYSYKMYCNGIDRPHEFRFLGKSKSVMRCVNCNRMKIEK